MLQYFKNLCLNAILYKKNTLYIWLKVKVRLLFLKGVSYMVSQVGLNTGFNNYSTSSNPVITNTIGSNNSIFNVPQNNYSDDIMMQNFDAMLNSALTSQAQQSGLNSLQQPAVNQDYNQLLYANNNAQSFTSNQNNMLAQNYQTDSQQQPVDVSSLNGHLIQRDKNVAYTENNNAYHQSNTAKKAGAFLGFLAPMGGKIVKLFQGGKFKDLFKFKQLAIACPALALAGLAVGSLVDGYINSKRAKEADMNATQKYQQALTQNQQYIA